MVVIGSRIVVSGQGAAVALQLADQLAAAFGPAGRWVFLLGFWGAVFTSLLGVWQSVPYIFADFLDLRRRGRCGETGGSDGSSPSGTEATPSAPGTGPDLKRTAAYRGYLLLIALVPMSLLWFSVKQVQLVYAVLGALFMPLLALTLLILNNRASLVGRGFRNSWAVNVLLAATLAFFSVVGIREIIALFG